jgi:hypothetical protein
METRQKVVIRRQNERQTRSLRIGLSGPAFVAAEHQLHELFVGFRADRFETKSGFRVPRLPKSRPHAGRRDVGVHSEVASDRNIHPGRDRRRRVRHNADTGFTQVFGSANNRFCVGNDIAMKLSRHSRRSSMLRLLVSNTRCGHQSCEVRNGPHAVDENGIQLTRDRRRAGCT